MSERLNRAWIETKLSLRERNALFDAILEETSAPTGEQILAKIAELFPKKKNLPSVRAINKWKANRWEFAVSLYEMRKTSEAAREVVAASSCDNVERANKALINEILYRKLEKIKRNPETEDGDVQGWINAASRFGAVSAEVAIKRRKARLLDEDVQRASARIIRGKRDETRFDEIAINRLKREEIAYKMQHGDYPPEDWLRARYEEFYADAENFAKEKEQIRRKLDESDGWDK